MRVHILCGRCGVVRAVVAADWVTAEGEQNNDVLCADCLKRMRREWESGGMSPLPETVEGVKATTVRRRL
jgi:hypothetical protein